MATLHRARWVLPIAAPPIREGWVLTRDGRIVGAGRSGSEPTGGAGRQRVIDSADVIDHGDVAILPGLVNAHTHLELSWMRGRVPPAASMPVWAEAVIGLRRSAGAEPAEPIDEAVREVRAAGTALVGDVTNTLCAYDVMRGRGLGGAVFLEILGFSAPDPGRAVADAAARIAELTPAAWLKPSIVPHAPYSVAPALFLAIAAAAGSRAVSVHLGESPEEIRFLRDGTGPWRDLLGRLGAWSETWEPPGCGPVEYIARLGLLTERLMAVHGTQFDASALARLADARATVVACPRSNRWTGAGDPPIDMFYASGVRVAVGTDSLASVEDLNLFGELAALRRLAPGVPAARLLESATLHGAVALGFGDEYGSIAPGKRDALIAVRVPLAVADVEEYLVGGVEPPDIRWIDRTPSNPEPRGTP